LNSAQIAYQGVYMAYSLSLISVDRCLETQRLTPAISGGRGRLVNEILSQMYTKTGDTLISKLLVFELSER
jgi:hypothetical protein